MTDLNVTAANGNYHNTVQDFLTVTSTFICIMNTLLIYTATPNQIDLRGL